MAVQHITKAKESWDSAIRRLAREAEQHGIAIYHHDNGQCVRYYATSQSEPGALHYVTLASCDCRGFATHQRCRHQAALLWATGNMPERPAPEPQPVAEDVVTEERCVNCFGSGTVGEEDKWCGPCSRCGGSGRMVIHWGSIAPTVHAA